MAAVCASLRVSAFLGRRRDLKSEACKGNSCSMYAVTGLTGSLVTCRPEDPGRCGCDPAPARPDAPAKCGQVDSSFMISNEHSKYKTDLKCFPPKNVL